MHEGPEVTIRRSCLDCKYLGAKNWGPEGYSSLEYFCNKKDRFIGVLSNTPTWCPFIPRGENEHNS